MKKATVESWNILNIIYIHTSTYWNEETSDLLINGYFYSILR